MSLTPEERLMKLRLTASEALAAEDAARLCAKARNECPGWESGHITRHICDAQIRKCLEQLAPEPR